MGASEMNIPGLGEVGERVRRYTVLVQPDGRGSGSGVVWSNDGLIVTNAHVARGSRMEVSLWDGREFKAEVTARDPRRDLAALRIGATGLNAATAANSSKIRAGEVAIAVGNPFGFLGAMTMGVVHGVGPLRGLGGRSWLQSDVRLAPGNSGGPLADVHGRVIGINTMVAGRLALAIASNDVSRFLAGDTGSHWLGVTVTAVPLPRSTGRTAGLVVLGVEPGGPAATASLMQGDILLGTEVAAFASAGDLAEALQGNDARILRLEFLRSDYSKVRRVSVSLEGRGRTPIAA
jgi:serine protease Do